MRVGEHLLESGIIGVVGSHQDTGQVELVDGWDGLRWDDAYGRQPSLDEYARTACRVGATRSWAPLHPQYRHRSSPGETGPYWP